MSDFEGAYPVNALIFRIGTKGRASGEKDMLEVAETTSVEPKSEASLEEWTPMNMGGWGKGLVTSRKYSVDVKAKRSVGNPGNDYVYGLAFNIGRDCQTVAEIEFPFEKKKIVFDCIVDVTNMGGGESTDVSGLEFTLHGDGIPKWVNIV
jgi:hypothetical protein